VGEMVSKNYLSAFAGRKVFITGHTGFKGSWLTFLLNELGAEVMGYALPAESPDGHFESLGLKHHIHHVEADIRDGEKLAVAMHDFQPEFVFHLAAQALVKQSYADPVDTFSTNVMGSANLLDAVRHCDSVRSLVYITSDKCYENLEWVWGYRENDRLGGHDPYSASKAAAEIVFSSYARSYFSGRPELGAASARAGNVIGGGDWSENRIIPDCIRAIHAGQVIRLRNPHATRPWQHVLEPLSGYIKLAACLRENPTVYAGAWNFGPPSSEVRTVQNVAEHMLTSFGQDVTAMEINAEKQHEAQLLQLNCDRAHQLLGWHPRWAVEKTLDATAEWYKKVYEGADVCSVTRQQIQDYFTELE